MAKHASALRLDRLHQFHQVASHRSLKAAARALHLSPPAVTHALARLEAELGCTLCTRGRAGFALTEAGRALFASTARIFDELRLALDTLDEARPYRGILSLGIQQDLIDARVDAALDALLRLHPECKLNLRIASPDELTRLLQRGELHAAISIFFRHSERLTYIPVGVQTLAYFVSDRHALWSRRRIGREDLAGQSVAWIDAGTPELAEIEREIFGSHRGYRMKVAAYSNSLQGGLRILLSGRAVVPLPTEWAARALTPFAARVRKLHARTRSPRFAIECAYDPARPPIAPLRDLLARLPRAARPTPGAAGPAAAGP